MAIVAVEKIAVVIVEKRYYGVCWISFKRGRMRVQSPRPYSKPSRLQRAEYAKPIFRGLC